MSEFYVPRRVGSDHELDARVNLVQQLAGHAASTEAAAAGLPTDAIYFDAEAGYTRYIP